MIIRIQKKNKKKWQKTGKINTTKIAFQHNLSRIKIIIICANLINK